MKDKIREIIFEEIKKLYERESKSSVETQKVISMASKYNFFLPYTLENTNTKRLTFYYGGKDMKNELQQDFNKFSDMLKRCGWIINQCGGHYDGLRNMYSRFEKEHPEFGVGTFFACVEA